MACEVFRCRETVKEAGRISGFGLEKKCDLSTKWKNQDRASVMNLHFHFAVIAALELAYFKGSGERIKFSEQEMTDCYNNGCEGGDYKMVKSLVFSKSNNSDLWSFYPLSSILICEVLYWIEIKIDRGKYHWNSAEKSANCAYKLSLRWKVSIVVTLYQVSITMSYIDKVSTRDGYGEFLSKQVTCRANTTPDALLNIKVSALKPEAEACVC